MIQKTDYPFPKNFNKDVKFKTNTSKYVKEAVNYVNKNFKDHPGSDNFYLSIDHQGAKQHLKKFLKERLDCFGPYQDAVSKDIIFGCHSVTSPFLNIWLLTPQYVVTGP